LRGIKTYLTLTAIIFCLTLASLKTVSADGPTISIIDSETGSNSIIFPEGTELNTDFTVNVTLTDTDFLAAWQINVTYDPTLINVTSVNNLILPDDNVFGANADLISKTLGTGTIFFAVGIKIGGPDYVNVTTGTLCQITFTIIKNDTGLPLQCDIHFVRPGENPIYTQLVDPEANEIEVTFIDANYTIIPEFANILLVPIILAATTIAILFSKKSIIKKHLNQQA
jgi:hypothetical protein